MEYVGAGQKSGVYWALDPATGAVRWKTEAGTGGIGGGLQWGSATDGVRVYTANPNSQFKPWPLQDTVLWDFTSGDQCYGGAAVVDGVVYWGSGYSLGGPETDTDQGLYALAVK